MNCEQMAKYVLHFRIAEEQLTFILKNVVRSTLHQYQNRASLVEVNVGDLRFSRNTLSQLRPICNIQDENQTSYYRYNININAAIGITIHITRKRSRFKTNINSTYIS